ncbi:hypothetical protein BGY98DRAFT_53237 [Russula aff. rugulosa BPL654]|nr:hypothetical protein BGY98DRAFT_53237 [Russula aff. rugulosa BPL654]
MKPVTPLRRSDRLRRPSSKAIGSSPCSSPGTAVHHSPSVAPRSRVFSAPGGQPDSDSTLRNTNSSKSSGSCTEDIAGDATDSMVLVASFPPKLHEAYQGLAPLLGHSNTELMRRDVPCLKVYLKQINAFLQKVIRIGFSCQWSEFNKFVELCDRIAKVIDAKGGTLSPKKQKKREETGLWGWGMGPNSPWVLHGSR